MGELPTAFPTLAIPVAERDAAGTISAITVAVSINETAGWRGAEARPTKLVGRDAEAARLDAIVAAAKSGKARFLELVGEPGIGKTALLDVLAERAEHAQITALRGRAGQLEQDVPFGVWIGALDDYLAAVGRSQLDLGTEQIAEAATIFPALADLASETRPALAEERYRSHRAVRGLLALLSRRRPLLVALDDLHWADEASLELLDHLLRHPVQTPLLIATAFRAGHMPDGWRERFGDAAREGALQHMEPKALTVEEARVLFPDLEPRAVARAHAESGGNPFYLRQLVEGSGDRHGGSHRPGRSALDTAHDLTGGLGAEVPLAVAAALAAELRSLNATTRIALEGAAVAGDPFELDLARTAADLAPQPFLQALDEAAARGLIRQGESPRIFHFRHPIVMRAVYEQSRPGFRLAAHARSASELARRGEPPTTRAHHVIAAATPGDLEAVELLEEAGRAASGRAPSSAARWFKAALELLPDSPENQPRRIELLLPLAGALCSAGRLADARSALRELLALLPDDAISARVETAGGCASLETFLSRHDDASRLLADTLAKLPPDSNRERARLQLARGAVKMWSNDHAAVKEHAEQALIAARAAGDAAHEWAALSLVGLESLRLAQTEQGLIAAERAAELFDAVDDAALAEVLPCAMGGLGVQLFGERTDIGIAHVERLMRIARASGQAHLLAQLGMLNWAFVWEGRLTEARERFDDMFEIAHLTGNTEFETWALIGETYVATELGDWDGAVRWAERALRAAATCSGEQPAAKAHAYPARLWLEMGDPARARQTFLHGCGGPELPRVELLWRIKFLRDLAHCELALGNHDAAERATRHVEDLAQACGLPGRVGWALTARARMDLALGKPRSAADAALEAAEKLSDARNWIDAARSRMLAGQALARLDDRSRAIRELETARAELAACGARRYADQAAYQLRKHGVKVGRTGNRGTALHGLAALSDRQREIAALVAVGKTNREIAATLYLSEKTVEKHLAAVFEKLGISRRAEVGGTLAAARDAAKGPR